MENQLGVEEDYHTFFHQCAISCFFASSLMENNHLNLGIIGKFHTTLAGGPSLSSSPLFSSIFFLTAINHMLDTPSVKQTCLCTIHNN